MGINKVQSVFALIEGCWWGEHTQRHTTSLPLSERCAGHPRPIHRTNTLSNYQPLFRGSCSRATKQIKRGRCLNSISTVCLRDRSDGAGPKRLRLQPSLLVINGIYLGLYSSWCHAVTEWDKHDKLPVAQSLCYNRCHGNSGGCVVPVAPASPRRHAV